MNHLPLSFYKYFWDVDPQKVDTGKQSSYIAERLLEFGNSKCLVWLEKTYGKDFLKNIVSQSRSLSLKSANFYSHYLDINPESILCLQPDYQRQHRLIWNR